MNKILRGMAAALKVARCEHALLKTQKQPSDKRYVRRYCPHCEATFISPKSDLRDLLRVDVGSTQQPDNHTPRKA